MAFEADCSLARLEDVECCNGRNNYRQIIGGFFFIILCEKTEIQKLLIIINLLFDDVKKND